MNILDYLDWRGDITFAERGLNEVDNLIFSVLAYIEMEDFVSADGSKTMTVAELQRAYAASGRQTSLQLLKPEPLLEKAAQTPRFKDVKVAYYTSDTDQENQSQFAAMTFLYREDEAYVAFRGTDNTIVGWREDFNLSFLDETPGQHEASAYLERVARELNCRLTVGGHSKGGNFAVYAAACCDSKVRDERVVKIYSNDGPGFKSEVTQSEGFAAVQDRIVKLIPGSSPVGIMLDDLDDRRFIRSTAKGALQHDPFSWCVLGTRIEDAADRSLFSYFVENMLSKWLSGMENGQRKTLVDTFFDALMIDGAQTIAELSENKLATYRAMMKALTGIESDKKGEILSSLQKLAASGLDTMKSGLDTMRSNRLRGKGTEDSSPDAPKQLEPPDGGD